LHIGKTHDQHLDFRNVAEAFPPARQEAILNFHRVIGTATNASMVLNLNGAEHYEVTYIMMTADVGLPEAVYRHTQDSFICFESAYCVVCIL